MVDIRTNQQETFTGQKSGKEAAQTFKTPNQRLTRRKELRQEKNEQLEMELMDDLPEGCYLNQNFCQKDKGAVSQISAADSDVFAIGKFFIDIDKISNAGLIKMRRIVPRAEYKLLKNRKSARLTRLAHKSKKQNIEQVCMALIAENVQLKAQLEDFKKKESQD